MIRWPYRTRFFLWIILTAFLLFFRARWALRPGGYDETCYLTWLHWLLGLPHEPCYSASHTVGIALVWWPLGLVARIVSLITSAPFLSVALPLIAFSSFALWGACLFLIDAILKILARGKEVPLWLPIVILANIPMLRYAAHDNFWNQVGEVTICLLVLYLCLRERFALATVFAVLTVFIRLNDAPILLLVGAAYYQTHGPETLSRKTKFTVASVVAAVGIGVSGWLWRVGFVDGYNGVTIPIIWQLLTVERVWRTFVMGCDGLFWMAGWFLFCLGVGLARFRKLSLTAQAALGWMAAELALVIGTNGIRSDYTSPVWRYLMGSYTGALLIWGESLFTLSPAVKRAGNFLLVLFAIWMPFQFYVMDAITIHQTLGVTLKYFPPGTNAQSLEFLLYPSALIKMLGQSPVGFTLFSWLYDLPAFSPYQHFGKYALKGYELVAMTIASAGAVVAWVMLSLSLFNKKYRPLV